MNKKTDPKKIISDAVNQEVDALLKKVGGSNNFLDNTIKYLDDSLASKKAYLAEIEKATLDLEKKDN